MNEKNQVGVRSNSTSASAVSRRLIALGYTKYAENDRHNGGYCCTGWGGTDTKGGVLVKVEYRRPGRGMRGKPSEETLNGIRREKLIEMSKGLREAAYYVSWGWDEETGDPDTSFIVASVSPARDETGGAALSPEHQVEHVNTSSATSYPEELRRLLISLPEIEEAAAEIFRAHNSGKDDPARRMEHKLYQQVLLAIVGGGEGTPREMAAAALITQHLGFPR